MSSESKTFESLYLPAESDVKAPHYPVPKYLIDGKVLEWHGEVEKVYSPIWKQGANTGIEIGACALQTEAEATAAVEAAARAYNNGMGQWPLMPVRERIEHVERYVVSMQQKRDEIVNLLMWEICKTKKDAQKEVDRTIQYIKDTINELKTLENNNSTFVINEGIIGHIRRAPLGIVLCLGPFNYPFNETYTTLIPALIMGNCVILKTPRTGVLCHTPTLQAFASIFPPGVVNVISGKGRVVMPPIMKSGHVAVFAFIGTNAAANALQKTHPFPHRLRVCLGLDAKNPAIILPDADLTVAVNECILGSLSFNGQRCTAIKIIFVHQSLVDQFLPKFSAAVDSLKMGLPWEDGVAITPLPEVEKPAYISTVTADALSKGAEIMNSRGGRADRSFVAPTILFPVNKHMRVYHEEQFGPVIPIATFNDISEIHQYLVESQFGQQASVFGNDSHQIAKLIDVLVNQVSRVNINSQCQRGPDTFPFTGRKDSAYGTLSVQDALRVFSIRAVVAAKETNSNRDLIHSIVKDNSSNFLRLDYLF